MTFFDSGADLGAAWGFAAPTGGLALAAGLASSLPEIQAWASELPADAYGQVLIESREALPEVATPAGVTVHRVPLGLEAGESLARAVTAWFDEWVWVEASTDRSVNLWACDEPVPAMRECWSRVERKLSRGRYVAGATVIPVEPANAAAISYA